MAEYTIDLYELLKDDKFNLFDFDYEFYEEANKTRFEEKFINHYMFYEIGFETVARFKHYLKERLNLIAPYYKQLYYTEVACKDIEFMLNKDLIERTTINTTNNSNSETTANTNNNSKESNLDNGNASIDTTDGNLTGVSENISIGNTNSSHSDNGVVTTEFISRGNIGVTSSAELLEKWRSVLINIDELIIKECADLFMQIY